jgi:hypothetical protein
MIQRANDPNANRAGWRPNGSAEPAPPTARPARPWPFLSKAHRPAATAPSEPKPVAPER